MVIRYCDGSYVEGAIQELESGAVRAKVAGALDAVRYTLIHDRWTSDLGAVVTFEFPMERGLNLCQIMPVSTCQGPAVCADGGDCALWRMSGPGAKRVN